MLLGIDVGGTHTDAVIIGRGGVVATAKIKTDHNDLIASLHRVLKRILQPVQASSIRRINLSTTLTTNAIVEDKLERVGVLAVSGPGLAEPFFNRDLGDHFYLLPGSIDHRGAQREALHKNATAAALADCRQQDLRVYAVAAKFSTRNPDMELELAGRLAGQSDFTTIGHRISGNLNFPRRLATAYYNSAVWRGYNSFADAMAAGLSNFNLDAPLNILKADGGTIDFANSRRNPVQTILSGPAASVMGIIALNPITEDAIILDIGGTTTDIAIFADGAPLLEKDGVTFGGRATLVRAITSRPIGIGGDSAITTTSDGAISVGPWRRGPALAFDGPQATLIDACNFKNLCRLGRPEKSIAGINRLAAALAISGAEVATRAIRFALDKIYRATERLLAEINQKPVYTVAEVLHGKTIQPKQLHIMGGPAAILAPLLGETFALPTWVPENYAVANAIGAALTRPTMEINLFADTSKKEMLIPNLGLREAVGSSYTLTEARRDGVARLSLYLKQNGHPELEEQEVSVTEAETFNMIDDYTAGSSRSIRVSCQIRPGLDNTWLKEVRNHAD